MLNYSIEYNGISNLELGVYVEERPEVPSPVEIVESITVPGRDGTLNIHRGYYPEIEITIPFCFRAKQEYFVERFREVKKWLKGSGTIIFSDDADYYYKVLRVECSNASRELKVNGRFEVTFVCNPYAYHTSGLMPIGQGEYFNDYSISKPIYKIKGEGVATLTVNGKDMRINVGQNLTIDTERNVAYREDGTLNNTRILSGSFEDLYLVEDMNDISITEGFELEILPNWRCL